MIIVIEKCRETLMCTQLLKPLAQYNQKKQTDISLINIVDHLRYPVFLRMS